ncbi:MAG: AAA family ATPase [Phycisphaerales bacterium]
MSESTESGDRPSDAKQIKRLLRAGHTCISIVTHEELHVARLVRDLLLDQGKKVYFWSAVRGVYNPMIERAEGMKDTTPAAAGLFWIARQEEPVSLVALDLSDHFGEALVVRAARELVQIMDERGGHLVMVDHSSELPAAIEMLATRHEAALPDEEELDAIARRVLQEHRRRSPTMEFELTQRQLDSIVRNLRGLTRRQAEHAIRATVVDDNRFDASDVNVVLEVKRRLMASSGALSAVDAPADLSQIAGLRTLKRWLDRRRRAFDDDAKRFGIDPPRGVLMLGVQGTGKSLTAKAIAAAWARPLLRLDAGALYSRYVGDSEANLRRALRQVESMAPCILWIDEIEKAFASAGSASNDGGLSRRMFGALLTWMQEHREPVFLVATANDINALPPELLRKGRFDEIFFVDLPSEEVRRAVLEIHLKKRGQDPGAVDVGALAAASEGFSPAELEQAVVSALHDSFATGKPVTTEMILEVVRSSPPLSVTAAERVSALREWAEGRCVPAD